MINVKREHGEMQKKQVNLSSMIKKLCLFLVVFMLTTGTAFAEVKNVIIMIPDGCSNSIQTLSRWYKGAPLASDEIVTGSVQTYMANSVITGSAAAATAFATGEKTTARFIGVAPKADDLLPMDRFADYDADRAYSPLATILEGAKLKGKTTGLVATSRITHATPAAFAAHIHDRGMDNELMEHMVYQGIDVVFGGGKRHLLTEADGGKRTDGENLYQYLIDTGYQFVETSEEMAAVNSGKVWGLFASSHMSSEIDREEETPTQPSLSEMTQKAIHLLSQNDEGFFLVVEGSQVDWAGHANDAAYMVSDFLVYDDAVRVALDFAKANPDTLLIAFPDHNTGAMSIGNSASDGTYTAITIDDVIGPLKGMKISSSALSGKIGDDVTADTIKAQLLEWWGITATDADISEIISLYADGEGLTLDYAISEVISRNHTYIGWTTHGHNGEDVPLWSFGPHRPIGNFDNTELALIAAESMGIDLDKVNERLFVDLDTTGLTYELDTTTNPENPVVTIGSAVLPCSKNILTIDGTTHTLEGLVVYAPETGKVYVPQQALNLITGNVVSIDINGNGTRSYNAEPAGAVLDLANDRISIPSITIAGEEISLGLQLKVTQYEWPITLEITEFK